MTKQEFVILLEKEVKGLSTVLDIEDYENAADDAARETGWSFPVTNDEIIYWMKTRAKRHLFFYLLTESAHKFKVKQYSLNQRFDHYRDIIDYMDKKWETFLSSGVILDDATGAFGTKIDAGFQYEPQTGRDTTYETDNEVIFQPNENS